MRTQTRTVCVMSHLPAVTAIIGILSVIGCAGGGAGNTSSPAPSTYTLGGTVSGLSGSGLVLQDNGGNNLTVSASGSFTFPTALTSGTAYNVTVFGQPTNLSQTCVPTSNTGTVTSSNVTNVSVVCTTNTFTVGGTASGLAGTGLALQDNGGNNLTVSANGSFTFGTKLASGTAYNVTAFSQPVNLSQTCVPTSNTGTVTSSDVTNVLVVCTTDTFTVGGTVSGLAGSGLVLQDNNGNNLSVAASLPAAFSAPFTFIAAIASGGGYGVTVLNQPSSPPQTCIVTTGSGTVTTAAISNVSVGCTPTTSLLAVADRGNNRVLVYNEPFSSDQTANVVLGEADFISATSGTTASTMSDPSAIAIDSTGILYVADDINCRVTQFKPPFSNGMSASIVFGQPDLTTGKCGATTSASSLGNSNGFDQVFGVAVDGNGNLWVSDSGSNRVVEYQPPFTSGMAASLAIGQPNLISGDGNQGGTTPTNSSLLDPVYPIFDRSGNLWVSDFVNNRVLEFIPPFSTGMAASVVLAAFSHKVQAM